MFFLIFLPFFNLYKGFWPPGSLPMDSERNFHPSHGLETPGSFFWTHFGSFSDNFRHFSGLRPFEIQLFSKKSIPCGRSGQSLLWKMMPYWISLYEVFAPRCRKHRFLPCSLQVFRKSNFSILSHLRTFSPGFCVYDRIISCSWKIMNWFLENHQGGIGAIWVACGRAGTCWQIGGGLSAGSSAAAPDHKLGEIQGTRE